jgi:hypothetical protein
MHTGMASAAQQSHLLGSAAQVRLLRCTRHDKSTFLI